MKKEYTKPVLQNLGKMRIVTQGGGSCTADTGSNGAGLNGNCPV